MKKEQHIRILVVEPGKAPYATVIENSLEGMQSVVGGYIEYVPLADDRNASLYCNDEGKINGLPSNRRLGGDIIAGTFFICGSDGGEYDCSLTDEQIARLSDLLQKRYGRPVDVHVGIDPEVLGGLRVRVGDELLDDTVARRLHDVRRRLSA